MNEAATLLAKCRERGISLRPGEGGKLKVSPPPERLPGEIVEALKRHKAEVLRLLTPQPPLTRTLYQELAEEPEKRQKPQTSPPDYRSLYWQTAETIREECFNLDACWLIDCYPALWERMVALDAELTTLEQDSTPEAEYRMILGQLVTVVQEAHRRADQERSKGQQVQ